jgi:hypothetical protein
VSEKSRTDLRVVDPAALASAVRRVDGRAGLLALSLVGVLSGFEVGTHMPTTTPPPDGPDRAGPSCALDSDDREAVIRSYASIERDIRALSDLIVRLAAEHGLQLQSSHPREFASELGSAAARLYPQQ